MRHINEDDHLGNTLLNDCLMSWNYRATETKLLELTGKMP